MIYVTRNGESFDTDRDLTSAERHILQKLFLWKDLAASVAQFLDKKQEALLRGWGGLGVVYERGALHSIIRDLEDQVARRLESAKLSGS